MSLPPARSDAGTSSPVPLRREEEGEEEEGEEVVVEGREEEGAKILGTPWNAKRASPDITTTSPLRNKMGVGLTSLDLPPIKKMADCPKL